MRANESFSSPHPLRTGARPSLESHVGDEVHILNVFVVFCCFLVREGTLVRLGGKLVKTRLELGVWFRQLRRKTTRQVIHEPFQRVGGVTHSASLFRRRGYHQREKPGTRFSRSNRCPREQPRQAPGRDTRPTPPRTKQNRCEPPPLPQASQTWRSGGA